MVLVEATKFVVIPKGSCVKRMAGMVSLLIDGSDASNDLQSLYDDDDVRYIVITKSMKKQCLVINF